MEDKKIVIKLGGSMVSKKENLFDFEYLGKLKNILESKINEGKKFFIVLGGGYTMRMYRDLAENAGVASVDRLHWIGTTVNVLHAQICKAYFADLADEAIVKFEDYYNDSPLKIQSGVKFGGGGRPGHSGDVDANIGAIKLEAKTIYSLKNVDGVYDSDPSKNSDAKRLDRISWNQYLETIGNKTEHEPGGNYPIDPIAAREAKQKGLRYIILGGSDLENFGKALNGEEFTGTIVEA